MTDYSDGNWHGWNGGECPVHPNSRIEAREWSGTRWTADAGDCDWTSMAWWFRVIKEHREPRVFWVNEYSNNAFGDFNTTKEAADYHCDRIACHRIVID